MRYEKRMEAASGFEPLNRGFADLRLTTWLRRRLWLEMIRLKLTFILNQCDYGLLVFNYMYPDAVQLCFVYNFIAMENQ